MFEVSFIGMDACSKSSTPVANRHIFSRLFKATPDVLVHPHYGFSSDRYNFVWEIIQINSMRHLWACGFVTMMKLLSRTYNSTVSLKFLYVSAFYKVVQLHNLWCGKFNFTFVCRYLTVITVKESLKSSHVWQNYIRHKNGEIFWLPMQFSTRKRTSATMNGHWSVLCRKSFLTVLTGRTQPKTRAYIFWII